MKIIDFTPKQMAERVARFHQLRYPPDRYPDSLLPGHVRKNYLVVGTGVQIEGGKDPMSAIPVAEGFQLSYVEAAPGNGPRLHNHDTNETFIAIRGQWKVIWGRNEEHSLELNPLDVCAVPAFVPRRFINLSPGDQAEVGLLMAVQPGDAPGSEFV